MTTNLIHHNSTQVLSSTFPFLNSTYGFNMAYNFAFGASPEGVHNGTDNVYWTASAIVGGARWDFADTTQFYDGAKSIDGTGTWNGDTAQFLNPSGDWDVTATGSIAITLWIRITSWPISQTNGLDLYAWDTGAGAQVGTSIDLSKYVNKYDLNVWQKATIPLCDMGLCTGVFDALRLQHVSADTADRIDFYVDKIQIETNGVEPGIYSITPPTGYKLYLYNYSTTFLDTYDTTLLNSNIPNVGSEGILSVNKLTNGFLYRQYKDGTVLNSVPIKSMIDMMAWGPDSKYYAYSRGGKVGLTITSNRSRFPIELRYSQGDRVEFIISDDMSGFESLYIIGFGYTEKE